MSRWTSSIQLRESGLALLALVLALVWMHPEVALRGDVYASSDAQAAAAFQTAGQRSLDAGEYPYWNPFVFGGMPSFASLAYNPGVYPLTSVLRAARHALGLPPMSWLLFHLLLLGAGMTGYLRWRGCSWASAVVGGVLLMSLPKVLAWSAYGHGTKVGTFAWLPWAMWAAEGLLRKGSVRWASLLAVILAMQLLRAHVQIVYYTVLAIGVWTIAYAAAEARAGWSLPRVSRRVGLVAVAGVLALGVAATLYLPVMEYQAWSIRGASGAPAASGTGAYDYATSWSMNWSEIATLWWPTVVGYGRASYVGGMPFTDYPHYVGLPVLVLALVGFLVRRDRWAWAAFSLVVFSTLVALGKYGPVYHLLYDFLPGFRKFRVPVMILCLQHFALLVLAMGGMDAVIDRLHVDDRPRWLGVPTMVALALVGTVLVLLSTVGAGSLQYWLQSHWSDLARNTGRAVPPAVAMRSMSEVATADGLRLGVVVFGLLAVGLALARGRLPRTAAIGLVGLFLFLDLWRVDQTLLHPEQHLMRRARQGERVVAVESEPLIQPSKALEDYTSESDLTNWLLSQGTRPRVWPIVGPRSTDNQLAARGIVSLGGYHAAKLKVYEDFRQRLYANGRPEVRLANLLGAQFILSPQLFSDATLSALAKMGMELRPTAEYEGAEGVVYRNRTARPRAWLVHEFELEAPGRTTTGKRPAESVLERVLSPDFIPAVRAIVSASPDPVPAPSRGQEEVELVSETDHHLRYAVRASAAGIVVLGEIWYPQWRARLDGDEVPLLRADHALRAVAVPEGDHVLELDYVAGAHRQGQWIRAISMLLILGGWIGPTIARRRFAPVEGAEGT